MLRLDGDDYTLLWALRNAAQFEADSSIANIAGEMDWKTDKVQRSMGRLEGAGFAITDGRQWYISTLGDQELELATVHPYIDPGAEARFIREALTGVTENGHRSKLERPVVPAPADIEYHEDYEDYYGLIELVLDVSRRFGVSVEDVLIAADDGELRFCNRCKKYGLFYRRGDNSKYLRSSCRKCYK